MALGAAAVLFYSNVFARAGLGELFAGLGLGALPVWGSAWVQGQPPGAAALWAGVPAFFMTFDLLLLNEFPDEQADRAGGRRNLVLLLGRRGAALVYAGPPCSRRCRSSRPWSQRALPEAALAAVLPVRCCWRSRSRGRSATPIRTGAAARAGAERRLEPRDECRAGVSLVAALCLR